ncbi:acyloxyacyl hydrolase [Candidatus Pelagibacter communis]|uniref:acyloxyacyl hydrolase n=1 Tax=Pelagibacter ubique TaxID=198252 RepID=UPI00094D1A7C|nr:acyloxyacyl hydrolase [Candidatus Pelagibacter ubique]
MKKIILILIIIMSSFNLTFAEEVKTNEHQLNFFTGNFDFSDHKQKSILVGFQHQNENLNRTTFLGNVSPITGGFLTENSAAYIYTGVEWNVDMGGLTLTPSFAPGLYHEGDGKDLGHVLEFKSEVQLSYAASERSSLSVSYNHVSNASLGDKNPGANSYMFNFIKNF